MRSCRALAVCLVCSLLIGCQENREAAGPAKNLDVELVNTLNHIGIENAVIAQHTLYPYHFVADGERLNDLGRHDLTVLAKHYAEHPGILNIRRDQTPDALYEARVAQVLAELKVAGVQTDRMNVLDGDPAGPGMPSERVVMILRGAAEESARTRTRPVPGQERISR